jgi:ADP-heptose:LPS heptosyltransferase
VAQDPGLPILLVGGPEDAAIGKIVAEKKIPGMINLIGQTSLKQLAAILQCSVLHVAGDTGSAHIAAALGTPVVSIFGRTNPDRLAPYGQRRRAIHHRGKCAAPCLRKHRHAPLNSSQGCLITSPACLAAITASEVARAIRHALSECTLLQRQ